MKDSECFQCHKTGHLQSECRNTKSPRQKEEREQHVRHAHQDSEAEVSEGAEDEFFGSIFYLDGVHHTESRNLGISAPVVKVPVRIEDVEFQMEVDTGAAASILSYADYERYFKYLALRPVEGSFHAYADTPLDVVGQVLVVVEHNDQHATLPLLVVRVEQYAPLLLGRSWMTKIRLDWRNLLSPPNGQFSVKQN